jgi:putative DNA primase/helicase
MNFVKDWMIAFPGRELNDRVARRAFETGATSVTIRDGRALTMEDIDALTGGAVGNVNVPCPYCGIPGKFDMKITRPSLASANFVCFYCGRSGEVRAEGPVDRGKEAEARRRAIERDREQKAERQAHALRLWSEGVPIKDGDPVRRYLAARGIFELPPKVDEVLRYHSQCPFGPGTRKPCLVGLFRDVLTDVPVAIHRTVLNEGTKSPERKAFGPIARAAIKLWPLDGDRLTVGEGIETTLAAVTRFPWREPLRPGWALTVARSIAEFPVIEGVRHLRVLVDNDESGTGQKAAAQCATRWAKFDADVIKLMPPRTGDDFNDLVRSL